MRKRSRISISAILVSALFLGLGLPAPAYSDDPPAPCYEVVDNVLTVGLDCLGEVVIDDSVTAIGENAFINNLNVTSIIIPNSVHSIGRAAFWGTSLSAIVIPEGVTSISDELFRTTATLTSVTIPSTVTTIGDYAFDGTGLRSITIPNAVRTIGTGAFRNTSLTSIVIPNGVSSVGQEAFLNSKKLESVTLPNSLESLEFGVFWGAESLRTINFSNRLKSIGAGAFYQTALSTILIPGSVETIAQYAFAEMPNLKTVIIQEGVKTLLHGVFSGDKLLSTVVIPNSITAVGGIPDVPDDDLRAPYALYETDENGLQTQKLDPDTRLPLFNDSLFALDTALNCATYPESMTVINEALNSLPRCIKTARGKSIPAGQTSATIEATENLPATTLKFGTTVETASVTVLPWSNPATATATPFVVTGSTKIVDIQVSGSITGSVTVCLEGAASDRIFHYSGETWVELPSPSYEGGKVCGVTTSFSPFTAAPLKSVAVVATPPRREAAEAAAKAAAEAAAAKREAEKQAARTEISSKLKRGSDLTVDSFAQADIPGITASNITEVQAEILALPEALRADINQVLKIARKYEVVGNIGSDQIKYLTPNSFIEIGLIPTESKNKVALVAALKKLPAAARDTYSEIKAVIDAETTKIQARKDRLASVVARNSSRTSKP